ncbi:hypothetical protein C8R45DRAFT_92732 [Mycena sanguinolenta]|nr:hypothetical protein C8R45DRAFT_92732 [Mycena sanguinolenta]
MPPRIFLARTRTRRSRRLVRISHARGRFVPHRRAPISRAKAVSGHRSSRSTSSDCSQRQSLSAPSVVSHARAESTSAADGPALQRKRYDTAGSRVERVEEKGFKSWSDRHDGARMGPQGTGVRTTEGSGGCTGVYGSGGEDKEKKEKRPKNVLRRRPGIAGRALPTPTTAVPTPAAVTPAVARAGPPMLNLNLSLAPMSLSFTGGTPSPKISPSDRSSSGSVSLTPAGAVVQAYKRGLDSSIPTSIPVLPEQAGERQLPRRIG